MKIIGFTGGMGCGKSTAINYLARQTGLTVLVKFAGPLYRMQELIYKEISPVYTRESDFVKDRKLLQWIGTEWGRGIDKNLWVNLWKAKAAEVFEHNPSAIVVCDDVRFDNEAETIKSFGGAIIKLSRPNHINHAEGGAGIANHSSEAGISNKYIDFVVVNDSSLKEFEASLDAAFKELGLYQW